MLLLNLQISNSWWIRANCGILGRHTYYVNIHVGTLHIFNGTLTEITYSAAVPVFRLVEYVQERVYGPQDYNLYITDMLDIEARPSPTGNSVTLFINGTDRSNNVTVMSRNMSNVVSNYLAVYRSEPSWGGRMQSSSKFNRRLWVCRIWQSRIFCTLYDI